MPEERWLVGDFESPDFLLLAPAYHIVVIPNQLDASFVRIRS